MNNELQDCPRCENPILSPAHVICQREAVKELYARPTNSHGLDWCLDEMYRRGQRDNSKRLNEIAEIADINQVSERSKHWTAIARLIQIKRLAKGESDD